MNTTASNGTTRTEPEAKLQSVEDQPEVPDAECIVVIRLRKSYERRRRMRRIQYLRFMYKLGLTSPPVTPQYPLSDTAQQSGRPNTDPTRYARRPPMLL